MEMLKNGQKVKKISNGDIGVIYAVLTPDEYHDGLEYSVEWQIDGRATMQPEEVELCEE